MSCHSTDKYLHSKLSVKINLVAFIKTTTEYILRVGFQVIDAFIRLILNK